MNEKQGRRRLVKFVTVSMQASHHSTTRSGRGKHHLLRILSFRGNLDSRQLTHFLLRNLRRTCLSLRKLFKQFDSNTSFASKTSNLRIGIVRFAPGDNRYRDLQSASNRQSNRRKSFRPFTKLFVASFD